MKIASCVLTYNGADIIDDVLANCAEYYYEEGIDIYYFDASVDDSTKHLSIICFVLSSTDASK